MGIVFNCLMIIITLAISANAGAGTITVESNNGSRTIQGVCTTITECISRADTANTTWRIRGALTAVQSNYSSATVHAIPANVTIVAEKGGSINPTTRFRFDPGSDVSHVTPEMFGANGGGVIDDTTALKRALDSLYFTGGYVTALSDKYKFTSQLMLTTGVHLKGKGMAQQDLYHMGTPRTRPTVLLKSGNFDGVILNGDSCSLEDISIDGVVDGSGVPANTGNGVEIWGPRNYLHNVSAVTHGGQGVVVGHGSTVATGNQNAWDLHNVTSFGNGSHGFYYNMLITSGPDTGNSNNNAGTATGCISWMNGGDGVRVGSSYGNTFIGGYSETNGGVGYHVMTGAKFNTFVNTGGELNTDGSFVLDSGSYDNAVIGSSNMYQPVDNGDNSFLVAGGGSVGRKGWQSSGVFRSGQSASTPNIPDGSMQMQKGFTASGALPGYGIYDTEGTTDNHMWETVSVNGILSHKKVTDAGVGTEYDQLINSGSYVTRTFRGVVKLPTTYMEPPPTFADNASATASYGAGIVYQHSDGSLHVSN